VTEEQAVVLPDRDHLVAGLVLLRASLSGQVPAPYITDLHTEVVRPLLDVTAPPEALTDLLRWGRVHGGAEALLDAACSEEPPSSDVSEEVRLDLLELADRMSAATGQPRTPGPDGPEVLVEETTGQCVLLTARHSFDHLWHAPRSNADETDVEDALGELLMWYSHTWPASWPEADDRPANLWWPPGIPLGASATTLPVVLWHLGRITGLGAPPVLTAGDVTDKNCEPLSGDALKARSAAARAANRTLLVPTPSGWSLRESDGTETVRQEALTMDGAATVVWGERWQQWKRQRHGDELAALGWRVIDWRVPPDRQPLPDLDVTQSRLLKYHFLDNSRRRSIAVLGGIPKSGKSTTVRRLAASLTGHKKRPWRVLVLAGETNTLPDRFDAIAAGRHALGTSETTAERQLLVFEGIRPADRDSDTDIGELLEDVSRQLNVSALIVLEHNENSPSEWQLGNTYVVSGPANPRTRQRFVEDLALSDPTLSRGVNRAVAACQAIMDLRRLTQLLVVDEDLTERQAERFADMANSERDPLVLAAAISLIGGEVDTASLAHLDESDHQLFGVVPGRGPDSNWLCGREDCLTLVDLHARTRNPADATAEQNRSEMRNSVITDVVEPVLVDKLNRHSVSVPLLFAGARLFHWRLARQLIARVDDELCGWASGAPATTVVQLLGLSELLPLRTMQALTSQLVARLPYEPPNWSPGQLLALAGVLQELNSYLPADVREKFVEWLAEVIDYVIHRRLGQPEERFALLAALERYDGDQVNDLLAHRVLDILHDLPIDQVSSYHLVREVEEMQLRLPWRTSKDLSSFPIGQERAVQALLNHEPDEDDGVSILIESMSLRQQFERIDWQTRMEPYERHLTAAMRSATAAEVARTLNYLHRSMPPFSTWLLANWQDFAERARTLLRKSAPTEAAMLINAISRSNALKVASILYQPNGTVNYNLVNAFAHQIRSTEDATGAGLLLMAVNSASELFHTGHDLFPLELAEEIGEDKIRTMIKYDPRASTHYYLITGVWNTGASYCERVLDNAVDVVVEGVQRRRKHWGAELALRLGAESRLGQTVVDRLRDRLPTAVLVRSMASAHTAHGRAMSHRLGRTLHPDVPDAYLRQWEKDVFTEGISTASPVSALELCAEAAKTLTEANLPAAGRIIFDATGGTDHWARKLSFGRRAEVFAASVTHLTSLDAEGAREVIDQLQSRRSQIHIGADAISLLAAWTRKAMLQDAGAAGAVISAIETAKPGSSSDTLAELAEDKHAGYVFHGDLQQMQDPVGQSRVARALVRAGVTRGTAHSSWIDLVYNARIQTVGKVTSPRATASLLHMLSAWDPQWGTAAAKEVNTARIGRRVEAGRVVDLSPTIGLVRTLCALDQVPKARALAQRLASLDLTSVAEYLELDALCQLLDIMQELDPDAVPSIQHGIRNVMIAAIRRPVMLEEWKMWRQVARAQTTLRRVGSLPTVTSEPAIRPNSAYAPAVAWAAVALDAEPAWGDNALDRMRAQLQRRWFSDAADQAYLLMATSRDWAPELRAEDTSWNVGEAPLWMIRLLYQEAPTDPYLAAVLRTAEPVIRTRLSRATARSDWDANRLRVILNAGVSARPSVGVVRHLLTPSDGRPQKTLDPTDTPDGATNL
jgi:Mrp family chromosome partitioning ATPase